MPQSTSLSFAEQIVDQIPALRRYARTLVRTSDRADDLVQDTIERALSRASLYQADTNLRAWLFTILRNVSITQMRRDKLRHAHNDERMAMSPTSYQASQTETIALKETLQLLTKLSRGERQAVSLLAIQEVSYEDAGEILGKPVGTMKSRLSRGRGRLRAMVGETEGLA
jgi:RNA polymerase sigma-70 factor (ECF subfamily)